MVGTAAIRDECGDFGPTLTNPIITLPPHKVSTYVPPSYSIGSTYTDPNIYLGPSGFVGHAEPLTVADLQCPTFGLGTKTDTDGKVYTTVGPPWLPIIIPPPEVFTLDPVWEGVCTDLASYYVYSSFAIFDPPFALVSETALAAPSPAASPPRMKDPPHVPANPTSAYDPPATPLPDLSDPAKSPVESIAPPVGDFPPPKEPPTTVAQPAAVPLDPAAKPTTAPDQPSVFTSEQEGGDAARLGSSGLGSSIFNAAGQTDPQAVGSDNADPTHIIPIPESGFVQVTVGGAILTISPSGLYLDGISYSPGGSAATLSGSVFSLVSSFPPKEATNADDDPPMNNQAFTPSTQTLAGHVVVSNASGVYVAGSSLSPGGSAITASNTLISLSPAGTIVIGSSSMALSLADTQVTSLPKLDVDGVTVQAGPSVAIVDGLTLKPGDPGTEINGKSITLQQDGTLIVGTSRLVLPPAQETPPSAFILDGMTVQAKASAAVIDGVTLTPGGPGTEINGESISLQLGGTLVVGTSHLILPPAQSTSPTAMILDGMTVQLQPSAVLIDGTVITPGAPGVSIDGKYISLAPDGILDIGTSQFALTPATATARETSAPLNAFSLNGIAVQAQQSGVVVDGVTLTAGGPGTIINGSSVSLEASGILDVGTGRFAIPTPTEASVVNGTSGLLQAFEGAQSKGYRVSCLLLGFVTVLMLWMVVS